ncbi:MAG: 5'/3'-nucleotidase SurE [Chlamydiota bacterium]|jgi:5'-nucleotidase
MNKKPTILLTNDDGIYAPGLRSLYESVKDFGEVSIIAPTSEKSGSGLGQSLNKPLKIHEIPWDGSAKAWAINGTPTDCMKLGFNVLLKQKPDIVLSGINRGSNAGRNILYSGTVGGVIEGVHKDVPGIAFSCYDYELPNYEVCAKFIPQILKYFLQNGIPQGSLINVNFPPGDLDKVKGLRLARQGKGYWAENPDQRKHPTGSHYYYWLGGKWHEFEEHPESDVLLLGEGFITVVPIYINELTHEGLLNEHREKFSEYFDNHLFNPPVDTI